MSEGFKKFDNLSMGIQATILLTDITMIGALVEKDGTLRNISVTIFILSLIFILVGKNHDDFHYYHFSYIVTLTEYPHPVGFGKLNHGFKTHSSIFLLSSLFSLPAAKYNLFHLVPAYILVFSNFILIKLYQE